MIDPTIPLTTTIQSHDLHDLITVVITTSPSPKHPSTDIISETIKSVRAHLPYSEIMLMMDGVRAEQIHLRANYEEYTRRTLWKCLHDQLFKNVLPLVFDEHKHQSGMMQETLPKVKTPLVFFIEGDMPLYEDREIPFDKMAQVIIEGHANLIRLMLDAIILPIHNYLMLSDKPSDILGVPLRPTYQWSQRPHLTSTAYYKRVMASYFNKDTKMMIEDRMYGVLENEVIADGKMAWFQHRAFIYEPEGDVQRAYHLDGRGAEPKFDDQFRA